MDVYLVGGAIRDRLLGLNSQEKDWVVINATPSDLKDLVTNKSGSLSLSLSTLKQARNMHWPERKLSLARDTMALKLIQIQM